MSTTLIMATMLSLALVTIQAPVAPVPTVPAKTAEPELSELERLKVENYVLRLQSIEAEMTRQRAVIDAAITDAHPGYRWDWQKGVLMAAVETSAKKGTP